ncbi:M16 family metallopeptidase [Kaistia adipata]|uniref:M16 family metallopeptidase n=1 Tax=Kaistia adipata TaxID=166954 RepID=UPI0003FF3B16|nr:pitrilysin family protein [Kaistia adipata]
MAYFFQNVLAARMCGPAALFIAAVVSVTAPAYGEQKSPTPAKAERVQKDELPKIAPDASTFTLDNGLQVVVIPDHRAPIVTHMMWYKVGAADDPHGKSGIAHYLEHLMFKGTKNHPAGEFSAKVSEVGGVENAFTSADATAYYQTVAKDQLGMVMGYEADRMQGLQLTDAVVLPERDVILEERRMRTDNNPGSLLGEAMDAALFQNHPYGVPIIGWAHEIGQLTREDAVAQYERYYTPNNGILVIAGDVTADEVRKLAEDTYGKLPRRAEPGSRNRPKEPDPLTERSIVLRDQRVSQPSWTQVYLAPSYISGQQGEAEALDILADVIGSGATSRLYRSLVVEQGLASAAGAYYSGDGLDYGRLGFYATPRGDVPLDKVSAAVETVLADVREHGITEEELALAKKRTRAATIYSQDNQAMLARIFGSAMINGQSLEDVQDWARRIDAVTLADVSKVATKYLDKRRSVSGSLLPVAADGRS